MRSDHEFTTLPYAQRFHLLGIWMLAATREGVVPNDARWIQAQLMTHDPVDTTALVQAGFLETDEPILSSRVCPDPSPSSRPHSSTDLSDREQKKGKNAEKSRGAIGAVPAGAGVIPKGSCEQPVGRVAGVAGARGGGRA